MRSNIKISIGVAIIVPIVYVQTEKIICTVTYQLVKNTRCRAVRYIVEDTDFSISHYLIKFIRRRTLDLLVLRELQVHRGTNVFAFGERTGAKFNIADTLSIVLDLYYEAGAVSPEVNKRDLLTGESNIAAERKRWTLVDGEAAKQLVRKRGLRLFRQAAITCVLERGKDQGR